jgi:hypothetical protein
MASGLDLLMSEPSQSGLDVLMAPPEPVKPVATAQGTRTGGVLQGINDVQNAAAQWLYNLVPQGAKDAGDSADHWLYDKTGGAIGTKPGLNFNNAVADQNAQYEASKAANGRGGVDWMRALGAGGAQIGLGALSGGASLGPVGAGVAGGALTPVTDITPGSNNTFAGGAAKNVAIGGAVGGGLGAVGNTVAGAISPKISATARALMGDGVQLTPGQIAGGAAKSTEDKLTSVPVVGDMIRAAQSKGVESLNIATYNRVLNPLKEAGFAVEVPKKAGREAVDSISTQVSDAYNSLLPKLTVQMDPKFAQGVGNLTEMVSSGNLGQAEAQQFSKILQTKVLDKFMGQNAITGETLKTMESQLGELASQYRSVPMGGAIAELQSEVRSLVQRSNPQYAPQLSKINEAFANLTRVQSAAAGQGAADGVFSAAQLASAVKGGDKTVRDNAYARGQALMQDLSDPAKKMLTASAGDSGTAGRAMSAGALGALLSNPAQLLNPAVLGTVLPAAAAYSSPGLKLLNGLAGPRSAEADALAKALRRLTESGAAPVSAGALAGR